MEGKVESFSRSGCQTLQRVSEPRARGKRSQEESQKSEPEIRNKESSQDVETKGAG